MYNRLIPAPSGDLYQSPEVRSRCFESLIRPAIEDWVAMAQDGTSPKGENDEAEHRCERCGATFDTEHGLKVHVSRWCVADADNTLSASDLGMTEIAGAISEASEESLKATLEVYDFEGKEGDSLETKTAKAVLTEKGGGSDQYRDLFGTCPEQDCNWGKNGFEASHCVRHQSETDDGGSEKEESSDSTESEETVADDDGERATYVAQLVEKGLSVTDAEKAAEVRFG